MTMNRRRAFGTILAAPVVGHAIAREAVAQPNPEDLLSAARTGRGASPSMSPALTAEAINAQVYPTRADLVARDLPSIQRAVTTSGLADPGVGAARHKLVSAEPGHAGKFKTPDGRWWELAETIVTPEMFGAKPNDRRFDSGPAIQAAYDAAFLAPWIKAVRHEGAYFSSMPLCPTAAQGADPGNFDMPFDLEFSSASITFTGKGHSKEAAFFVKNNSNQRSVRGGVIRGSLVVLNEGDWRDGIEMQGCNDWSVGKLQAGDYDPLTNAARKAFRRNGIRYVSNNGKGGLWNDWGQADAYGGELPIHIGPVANANAWGHVFAAYGSIGQFENLGDRNTIQHLSCEVQSGRDLLYIVRNVGAQTVVEHFEFEKQDAGRLSRAYQASIWAVAGTLVARGSFYALATGAFWKVERGAILDLTYINETNETRRVEHYSEPPTRFPTATLRRGPRKIVHSLNVGLADRDTHYRTIGDGLGVKGLLPLGVIAANKTNQDLTLSIRTVDIEGSNSPGFSTAIAAGGTYHIGGAQLAAECTDNVIINLIQARARTSSSAVTGALEVTVVYLEL